MSTTTQQSSDSNNNGWRRLAGMASEAMTIIAVALSFALIFGQHLTQF
jgi:nitrogen fixation protein FixH